MHAKGGGPDLSQMEPTDKLDAANRVLQNRCIAACQTEIRLSDNVIFPPKSSLPFTSTIGRQPSASDRSTSVLSRVRPPRIVSGRAWCVSVRSSTPPAVPIRSQQSSCGLDASRVRAIHELNHHSSELMRGTQMLSTEPVATRYIAAANLSCCQRRAIEVMLLGNHPSSRSAVRAPGSRFPRE
jgi:hypothetical protein